MLDRLPLFYNAVHGEAPRVDLTVNHHQHSVAYYWLADGIYPTYARFVKTIPNATTRMQKLFVTAQEAKRKDTECASRFHILTPGCRLWDCEAMDTVIRTCVLLRNLIIDYKRKNNVDGGYINDAGYVPLHHMVVVPHNPNQSVEEREALMGNMQNMEQHNLL